MATPQSQLLSQRLVATAALFGSLRLEFKQHVKIYEHVFEHVKIALAERAECDIYVSIRVLLEPVSNSSGRDTTRGLNGIPIHASGNAWKRHRCSPYFGSTVKALCVAGRQ